MDELMNKGLDSKVPSLMKEGVSIPLNFDTVICRIRLFDEKTQFEFDFAYSFCKNQH